MRLHSSLCAFLVATFASCASAPAPQASEPGATSPNMYSADIERTRERRLDELRAQLSSQNAQLVAWAAWRCGDEGLRELAPEVRAATTRWSSSATDVQASRLVDVCLDALVQLQITPTLAELRAWQDAWPLHGSRLVLGSRTRPFPTDEMFAAFRYTWWDTAQAERQAAGNWLAAQRSPEIVSALLAESAIVIRVDVVDSGEAPGERGGTSSGLSRRGPRDWPPAADYRFDAPPGSACGEQVSGAVDVAWTRRLDDHGSQHCDFSHDVSATSRTYSADVLAWLADSDAEREPFGDQQVIVDLDDVPRAIAAVEAAASQARERWARVIGALRRMQLLPGDVPADHAACVVLDVRDWRMDDTVPLPQFGH